jgi:hypothetical protein
VDRRRLTSQLRELRARRQVRLAVLFLVNVGVEIL